MDEHGLARTDTGAVLPQLMDRELLSGMIRGDLKQGMYRNWSDGVYTINIEVEEPALSGTETVSVKDGVVVGVWLVLEREEEAPKHRNTETPNKGINESRNQSTKEVGRGVQG